MRVGKSRDLFQVQDIYDEEGESVRARRQVSGSPGFLLMARMKLSNPGVKDSQRKNVFSACVVR
jgi:hypothetical protein